jgi:hypothetical protein
LRPLTRLALLVSIVALVSSVGAGAVAIAAKSASRAAKKAPAYGAFTNKGAYSYASAPSLHPPKLAVDKPVKKGLAPGYFMVANFKDLSAVQSNGSPAPIVGQSGPLILDHNLQPVWFRPVPTNVMANNLTTQVYNGKPALSWWQGVVTPTGQILSGEDVVVDQHYHTIATLHAAQGWVIALHELQIVGTDAWVIASRVIPAGQAGGPAGTKLVDTAVQKYELKTGKLLYTWDPAKYIPLKDTHAVAIKGQLDAYHANSVSPTSDGNILVSLRNTWGAYLINPTTNQVEWQLGGKPLAGATQFRLAPGDQFQWQHDVQLHPGNVVTMFDDHCCGMTRKGGFSSPTGPSRGLVLKLNTTNHTVSRVRQYVRAKKFDAGFLGNTDLLPNGNVAIGWGSKPYFSEYSKTGKLLLDAVFPGHNLSYRTYVQSWVGLPTSPPAGAVRVHGGKTTVYASWNGAIQVSSWQVLGGTTASALKPIGKARKSGFETAIPVSGSLKAFKVVALDGKGHTLGTSKAFPRSGSVHAGY